MCAQYDIHIAILGGESVLYHSFVSTNCCRCEVNILSNIVDIGQSLGCPTLIDDPSIVSGSPSGIGDDFLYIKRYFIEAIDRDHSSIFHESSLKEDILIVSVYMIRRIIQYEFAGRDNLIAVDDTVFIGILIDIRKTIIIRIYLRKRIR